MDRYMEEINRGSYQSAGELHLTSQQFHAAVRCNSSTLECQYNEWNLSKLSSSSAPLPRPFQCS